MAAAAPSETSAGAVLPWAAKGDVAALDRLPVVIEAMTMAALAWTGAFANLAQTTPFEITLGSLESRRVDDMPGRRGEAAIFALLDAPDWRSTLGLGFDRRFVATVVEILFGGDGGEDDESNRPVTPMMLQIAELLARQAAEALGAGFAVNLPVALRFDRMLTKPDLAALGKSGAGLLVATFTLHALGHTTCCDVMVPQAALQARAGQLAPPMPIEAEAQADPDWARQLEAEIGRTMMGLRARIDVPSLSLGAVASLRPGQVLALPTGAGNRITLGCADEDLFRCDLGQSEGFYTVRIREALAVEAGHDDWQRSSPQRLNHDG